MSITKNALIYLRVSTNEQAQKGISIPSQKEACVKYAKENGYEVIGEYTDAGESARTADRPAFIDMLNRCNRDKTIDAIIVYDISRFSRDRVDFALAKKELRKNKVVIRSVTESINETPEGQVLEGILSSVAEFQSTQHGRRVKLNMIYKAENGWFPGIAPYGYKNVQEKNGIGKDRRWIEIDEKEAIWIKKAFRLYATERYSLDDLVFKLRKQGFPTRNKKPLHTNSLTRILQNPFYIGIVKWDKVENPNGKHKPLIKPSLFNKVQTIFRSRNAGANRQRKYKFLLRGIAYCGECGSRIQAEEHKIKNGKIVRYYRCQKHQHRERVECNQRCMREEIIDGQFEELMKVIQIPNGVVKRIRERLKKIFSEENAFYEKSRKSLMLQIENLKLRQKKLLEKFLDGKVDDDLYEESSLEMREQEKKLNEQLTRTESSIAGIIRALEIALFLANNCYKGYQLAGFDLRKLLARTFFNKILVKDKKIVQAELNVPLDYLCRERIKNNALFKLQQDGGPYRA